MTMNDQKDSSCLTTPGSSRYEKDADMNEECTTNEKVLAACKQNQDSPIVSHLKGSEMYLTTQYYSAGPSPSPSTQQQADQPTGATVHLAFTKQVDDFKPPDPWRSKVRMSGVTDGLAALIQRCCVLPNADSYIIVLWVIASCM